MTAQFDFPSQTCTAQVFGSADWLVAAGVNEGDRMSFARDLVLDDYYRLMPTARPKSLSFIRNRSGRYIISNTTSVGRPGARMIFDCTLTFMSLDGHLAKVINFVEVDTFWCVHDVHTLPLTDTKRNTDYCLIEITRNSIPTGLPFASAVAPITYPFCRSPSLLVAS